MAFASKHCMLQRLAGPLLDNRYAETVKQVDDRLAKQSIGVQMATDGWKRKNVNEAQKIQNFIANFPDGGTQFLTAYNTEVSIIVQPCASSTSCVYDHDSEASCCDRVCLYGQH